MDRDTVETIAPLPGQLPLPGYTTPKTDTPAIAHARETQREPAIWHSSDNPDWITPRTVLDPCRAALGGTFDLDPASSLEAQKNVQARLFYTPETNGLEQAWRGSVWLNAPFDQVDAFIQKAWAEWTAGHITRAIILTAVRPDTFWWQILYPFTVCFWSGRIKFERPSGPAWTAPFPAALFYMGIDDALFCEQLEPHGLIYSPCGNRTRLRRVRPVPKPRSAKKPGKQTVV